MERNGRSRVITEEELEQVNALAEKIQQTKLEAEQLHLGVDEELKASIAMIARSLGEAAGMATYLGNMLKSSDE